MKKIVDIITGRGERRQVITDMDTGCQVGPQPGQLDIFGGEVEERRTPVRPRQKNLFDR